MKKAAHLGGLFAFDTRRRLLRQTFDRYDAEGRVFVTDRLGFLVGGGIMGRECLIKTVKAREEQVQAAIRELHSYELAECIAIPIESGSAEYLKWLSDSVE